MAMIHYPAVTYTPSVRAQLQKMGLLFADNIVFTRPSRFNVPSYIKKNCTIINVAMDAYSSISYYSSVVNCTIGRYCSIAHNVDIGLGIHEFKLASTSPAFTSQSGFQSVSGAIDKIPHIYTVRREETNITHIMHNVWIGSHVLIPSDVTIGTGAVVGSGSIVTRDIPPYAIAAGNPARVKRYRFSDEIIADLLDLKWWQYDLPKVQASGLNVPIEDPSAFIAFVKEHKETLPVLGLNWMQLNGKSNDRCEVTKLEVQKPQAQPA